MKSILKMYRIEHEQQRSTELAKLNNMSAPIVFRQYIATKNEDAQIGRAAQAIILAKRSPLVYEKIPISDSAATTAATVCLQPLYQYKPDGLYLPTAADRQQILQSAVVTFGHAELRRMIEVCDVIAEDFEQYSEFIDDGVEENDNVRELIGNGRGDADRSDTINEDIFGISDLCWRVVAASGQAKAWLQEADRAIHALATMLRDGQYKQVINGVEYRPALLHGDCWYLVSSHGGKQTLPFQAFGAFSETDIPFV